MLITYRHLLYPTLSNFLVNMWEYSYSLALYIYIYIYLFIYSKYV